MTGGRTLFLAAGTSLDQLGTALTEGVTNARTEGFKPDRQADQVVQPRFIDKDNYRRRIMVQIALTRG